MTIYLQIKKKKTKLLKNLIKSSIIKDKTNLYVKHNYF